MDIFTVGELQLASDDGENLVGAVRRGHLGCGIASGPAADRVRVDGKAAANGGALAMLTVAEGDMAGLAINRVDAECAVVVGNEEDSSIDGKVRLVRVAVQSEGED